ncbi:MAG TPA: hypothetical protein VGC39_02775 [Candidatus Methylacidiphilales bacterium]
MKTNTNSKVLAVLLTLVTLPGAAFANDTVNGTAPNHRVAHGMTAIHNLTTETFQVPEGQMIRFNVIDGQPVR